MMLLDHSRMYHSASIPDATFQSTLDHSASRLRSMVLQSATCNLSVFIKGHDAATRRSRFGRMRDNRGVGRR